MRMDTTGFFDYPTEPSSTPAEHGLPGFLSGREDDWGILLEHSETRIFHPGEVVLAAGERDRAMYLLVDGWLKAPSGVIHPITTVGEGAFLDGSPRAVTVIAMSDGEMLRLSYDGYEALAARNPALGRDILLDLGRIMSARLRSSGEETPGWTG
jgi:CRP/FNR family cyclic AMP-dependent transcriptional regulator